MWKLYGNSLVYRKDTLTGRIFRDTDGVVVAEIKDLCGIVWYETCGIEPDIVKLMRKIGNRVNRYYPSRTSVIPVNELPPDP